MNILKVVIRKIIVSILSSFILSGFFVYMSYTPLSEQRPGIMYWTLGGLWMVSLIYTLPVFLIGGTLYSVISDSIIEKLIHQRNYFVFLLCKIFTYILGGVLVTILFSLIISSGRIIEARYEIAPFFIFGVSGSIIYLLIEELIKAFTKKIKLLIKVTSKKAPTAYNTALTHRRMRSSVTGGVFSKEEDSRGNLLCAGSLMQERYMKLVKNNIEQRGISMMRIIVTGGAIIRDKQGRILLQRRSDYGNWGLPGGGMNAGESIEETMIREVYEETGLEVNQYEFYSVYSGSRMKYRYPDGNEVVFVMFLFNAKADLEGKIADDNKTLIYKDDNQESLRLEFKTIEEINIEDISIVQRPVFEDLKIGIETVLRT